MPRLSKHSYLTRRAFPRDNSKRTKHWRSKGSTTTSLIWCKYKLSSQAGQPICDIRPSVAESLREPTCRYLLRLYARPNLGAGLILSVTRKIPTNLPQHDNSHELINA